MFFIAEPEVALVSFLNLKSSKAFNPLSSPPPTVDMHDAPGDKDLTRCSHLSGLSLCHSAILSGNLIN